jgi:saccharopine dehydrogenase-like NADP-dependent oxidoreductase
MQIITLGGAGAMAGAALHHLALTTDAELVVADRDERAAAARADELGGRARAIALDLTDTARLVAALEDADIVLNLAGPYYRFGRAVLEAAISTRTHYLDICDDPAPTLDMLDLHDAAAAAAIVAIVGMGASPGVSNLMARLAADRLDTVERITTGWPEDPGPDIGDRDEPTAAAIHWVHQCAHPIQALVNGHLTHVQPLQKIEIHYPGVGAGTVTTVGHPEAVTLQRAYPALLDSRNVMVITPALHDHLERTAALVAEGHSDLDAARELLRRLRTADLNAAGPAAAFPWLFALAEGTLDGRPTAVAARLAAYPPGGMAGITGTPLAIAARLVASGTIDTVGVHAPETSVPPTAFFDELVPWCVGATNTDELIIIS